MRIFVLKQNWQGDTLTPIANAFRTLGFDVFEHASLKKPKGLKTQSLRIINYPIRSQYISEVIKEQIIIAHNQNLLNAVRQNRPDVFFMVNEVTVLPETLAAIKQEIKCKMILWVADNPFDSSRYSFFPLNLSYFDNIFIGDKIWYQSIKNLAPKARIEHLVGAYEPEKINIEDISETDIERFTNNLSFVGTSYGKRAEGLYRLKILEQVSDLGLKLWGSGDWSYRFKFLPKLKECYQGGYLTFSELHKLYNLSLINLNIPNPQVFTSFQSRVFEIAASKGFQIVDYRPDILDYFKEDEIVTFDGIDDLREKIQFFQNNPARRESFVQKMYDNTIKNHSYERRINQLCQLADLKV